MVSMLHFRSQEVSQISLKIVANCSQSSEILALANSADHDEMQLNAACWHGLICLQNNYLWGFCSTKG